jgi:tricorn protease
MNDANSFSSLYVWTLADRELHRVTGETFNEFSPAWDPEGNYLYYMSDREFSPQIGSFEFNYALDRETFIYVLGLRADVKDPFPPESDEVKIEEDEDEDESEDGDAGEDEKASGKSDDKKDGEKDDGEDGKDGEEEDEPIVIEFDGLAQRVARVPVEADNYGGLSAIEGHLLYVRGAPFVYGRQSDVQRELRIFSMEDRKETTLAEGVGGGALSADGKKVLVRQNGGFKIFDASPKGKDSGKAVSTAGLVMDRVPEEEWAQIFDEVWRRYRDFFYVKNMHGYDWDALRRQYRPLLQHVAHRSDLNYLIGEMIAELNVGHAYISGGDYEVPSRAPVALPGAEFVLDAQAGRYRIARILPGQNQEDGYRSPLTEIGVDAREGDYVLAIDGEELTAGDNPYRLLRYKANRPVALTLNDRPEQEGAREVIYQPLTSESSLRYLDMVLANRRRVHELSGGKVGYLHIPDMGSTGISEFIKWYYGQIRKEGLVVDVRGNGGGNVSQMIIQRLNRDLLGTRFSRNNDFPRTYPAVVFHGPMVCLLSEDSASDGDIFPHMFRQAGLGPLIGKRSWGGVTGITNRGTLIDGGTVFVPEFGTNAVDGSWIIEGYGVEPDIEVDNDARSILEGRDPQLERGVEEVLKQMRANPQMLPERPKDPVKTE